MPPDPTNPDPNNPNPDNQDWKAGLPEDLRSEKSFLSIKGKDWTEAGPALAKQYLEAQKYNVGALRIPKPDATPEERAAFNRKLGWPEKPEDYGITKPANAPEGAQWNEKLASWYMKTAHKIGMPKAMAQAFMSEWNATSLQDMEEQRREATEALKPLRDEWGARFEGNMELSRRGQLHYGGQDLEKDLKETGALNRPTVIKAFQRIGKMLLEQGYISGDGQGGALGLEAVEAKIQAVNAEYPKHPYWDGNNPAHDAAVEEMKALFKERDAIRGGRK